MADQIPKQTYAAAGVDIDAADSALERIKRHTRSTLNSNVLRDVGFFNGLFELKGYQEPVLVSSVDGVGTKLKIATALDKHDTIGIDLVNHCVNDILTSGAKPLFFLDYIGVGKVFPDRVGDVVKGLAQACREVGCALVGGETAEMPGVYAEGDYDLVGCIVGVVEKSRIIDISSIRVGDILIGLPSSGLHTNGYSLVRKIFDVGMESDSRERLNEYHAELGCSLGEELLKPHRCYYNELYPLLPKIKGLAHVTGGGLLDNIPRSLGEGLSVRLKKDSWDVLPIFEMIRREGNIDEMEMYRVFNMGIGMAVFCASEQAPGLMVDLPDARRIGEVIEGSGQVILS